MIINNTMHILYGTKTKYIDVTAICYEKLLYGNMIIIPAIDVIRASFFSDPAFGVKKSIFTIHSITTEWSADYTIFIDVLSGTVTTTERRKINVDDELLQIHKQLKIEYGTMTQELNEQRMVVQYLTGTEKVLELGGNIGRNSLVISSIMKKYNNANLVVFESDPNIAEKLRKNRDRNNMQFHIEPCALSKRKLVQKGWQTIDRDELEGYTPVNTITYQDLMVKYGIQFDTLVIDCEGAFYYILIDMPEILDNIRLIIVENDYTSIEWKEYVDSVLKKSGFYVDYSEIGGWGPDTPCLRNFYEVWIKYPSVSSTPYAEQYSQIS